MGIEAAENRINDIMLNQILASCDVNFEASLDVNVEDHRLRWKTFANLSLCFESWERTTGTALRPHLDYERMETWQPSPRCGGSIGPLGSVGG